SFNFTTGARASRPQPPAVPAGGTTEDVPLPRVTPRFDALSQFLTIVKMEALATFKSVPFVVILLCGIFLVVGEGLDGARLGEPLPVTREMMSAIAEAFIVFSLMIAGFYAGDAVWRERGLKTNEMTDAMPVPTWTQWAAKLAGLAAVSLSTLVAAVLTAIALQAAKGYYDFELELYLRGVIGLYGSKLLLVTALAFVFQVVFNHRMAGFIGIAVWFVGTQFLRERGYNHILYRFGSTPPAPYSDMNGFGHFVAPALWTLLHWALCTALLLTLVHLLWNRGTELNLRHRLRVARRRFTPRVAVTAAAFLAAFASTGCFIYYNTNVLNTYRTEWSVDELAARLEKTYKQYADLPQPRIVAVKANVDIHPAKRAVYIDGSYVATNKSDVPIRELHVTWSPSTLTSFEATVPGARVKSDDRELGYRIYAPGNGLQPGDSITMTFKAAWEARGFVAGQSYNKLVHNGTFLNSLDSFPHIGYSPRAELEDEREEHGLPPQPRLAPPDDLKARGENAFARRTDWLSLDTTVSTSADQIAIAPGYLQREWTANGRRWFHYKTDAPIRGYWSYLSARYEVKRDAWNGIPIEVYYDAKHPHNVDRMIAGVKKSLAYYSRHFGPYQHKQARIVEFPGYATFAQAFPNTITWSENIGFITDLRDPRELDYVTYAAAHEIGHQWWGHQVMGGNVQGVSMLNESLAQYSALMVLEQEHGPATMKRYLRYELDRYLSMRGNERVREMPLMLVERQSYIHYQKGAVVFYALRDYLGEERLNRALSKFLRDYAYTGPPYTTAKELVKYIRAEAPPEYQNLITDLFERITLYDLATKEVAATRRADGTYVVTLTVSAAKLYADGAGNETAAEIDDWIDIGVFTGPSDDNLGKTLFAEKKRITKRVETFEIVVNEKPARAGIDPFNKLIDRTPRDNTKGM
ncbi:MAG TPA: M1 family aminopeptidase, partial [Thermoanaerobaculia bacterium]|nr:M1 family aminopeptidase [Thermoanaerobaculia bacterium]